MTARWVASPLLVGAIVTVALLSFDWPFAQRVDLAVFDWIAPSNRSTALDDVVVVAIDDASIAELGPWPWSRATHARMVDRLHAAGVAAIGYDILFAERSSDDAQGDAALVAALSRSDRVVLPIAPVPLAARGAIASPNPFDEAARDVGHVDVEIDADAIARRMRLEVVVDGARIPAFPVVLGAVRDGRGRAADHASRPASAWTHDDEVLVPRASGSLATVPFVDVLRGGELDEVLRGKTVLVGVTATGIGSRLATTFARMRAPMPAVDFLAWTYVAVRSGTAIVPLTFAANAALSLAALLALCIAGPRRSRWRSIAVALAVTMPLAMSIALLHVGHVWFAPLAATAGLFVGIVVWRADRLRDARRQLFRAQQQAKAALDAVADGVVTVDDGQSILYATPIARQLAGHADLRGRPVSTLFVEDPPHRPLVTAAIVSCMAQRRMVRVDVDLALAEATDERRLVRVTATPLIDSKDRLEGAVLAIHDVTEAAAAAARLDHAATHDALTGLPNRVFFRERLRQAIAESKRSGATLAVLFIDLDRFKRINDSLGHRFGDEVLKVVADRLRSSGRAVDMAARWGGDEFVVLLCGLPSRESIETAAHRLMKAVSQTIDIDGMELHCACSLGIALAPHDAVDVDSLLAMADLAMYRGRARAPGHLEFYAPEMTRWNRDRLRLESDLRRALAQHEFELHYQAQIDLLTGEPVGLEALLRWRTASGDLILPDDFIDVAEESGLILAIGEWVIEEATGQVATWTNAGAPLLPVAINVSARQCLDHGLIHTVRDALRRTAIDPGLIVFEITETTAMRNVEHAIDLLTQISALGIGIAVDDFGTGYSSLSYLKRFPIDQLEIDQSFVRDIDTDGNDAAIVVAILALAHSLGWTVIAEGVETEAQRAFLAERHCDLAQGYLFCRPLPASELESTLFDRAIAQNKRTAPSNVHVRRISMTS